MHAAIDIGSTECVRWSESLPLGVVRLSEQGGGTAAIRAHIDQLLDPVRRRFSAGRREELPGLEPGRGDLIVPGLQIVLALLDITRSEQLTVSDFGLLEGLVLRLFGRGAIDPDQPGRD